VYIGVIDEGIMHWHPDLCQNIWVNPFDPVDGIDNDGNGYIDDIHGYDFMNNDNQVFDQLDNHGTWCAGKIASSAYGVSKYATIISGKFLQGSGTLENAIRAIDYMTDLKIRHNLPIIGTNNSWGGTGYYQPLVDAINRANQADILFFCAAGNSGLNIDNNQYAPADIDLPNVITVGAIDINENKANFSNYGSKVELYAPGVSVPSTVFVTTSPYYGYSNYSGTSMSTPHVAGAAVLYKALHPDASGQQIKNAILNSTRTVNGLKLLDVSSFTGQVNSNETTKECQPTLVDVDPPTQPTNLRIASTGSNSITVTWDAPYDNTGVEYLRLGVNPDGLPSGNGMDYNFWGYYTSWTAGNLTPGVWYRFRMVADDKYLNRSDSSNILWAKIGDVAPPPPADSRTITLSGSASGKIHTLNWIAKEPAPNYSVRNNTGVIAVTTSNTFTTTATKKGSVSYTIVGNYPDKQISSNSITLKTNGR
jgi:subtilisin family serine protease